MSPLDLQGHIVCDAGGCVVERCQEMYSPSIDKMDMRTFCGGSRARVETSFRELKIASGRDFQMCRRMDQDWSRRAYAI